MRKKDQHDRPGRIFREVKRREQLGGAGKSAIRGHRSISVALGLSDDGVNEVKISFRCGGDFSENAGIKWRKVLSPSERTNLD